jgi:choline-sulfatase
VAERARGSRPNLLLAFPDQLRAEAMGCAGCPAVCTPCLDALVSLGMRFGCAVANCLVCTPSRGAGITAR